MFSDVGDKALKVGDRQRFFGADKKRERRDQADRSEIAERIVSPVWIEHDARGMRPEVAHEQPVAIGRSAGDPERADGSAGANHVLDDDGLTEVPADMLGENPRDRVGASTCRKGHHHGDRAGRIGLRQGRERLDSEASRSTQPNERFPPCSL